MLSKLRPAPYSCRSLKQLVAADPGHYIHEDLRLAPMLDSLRAAGKKLFLATNSQWDYTHVVMNFLLSGAHARCFKLPLESGEWPVTTLQHITTMFPVLEDRWQAKVVLVDEAALTTELVRQWSTWSGTCVLTSGADLQGRQMSDETSTGSSTSMW